MEHNVDFGAEAEVNHAFAVLRALDLKIKVASDEHFVPGFFVSTDPESDTRVQVTSRPGALLDLDFRTTRPGSWLSLNIELGAFDLSARDILGFMCKTTAEDTLTFRVSLRSGQDEGFGDAFFGKRVISYNSESTHADLTKLTERDDILPQAPWRQLVLFFPPDLRQIKITDFALFGV